MLGQNKRTNSETMRCSSLHDRRKSHCATTKGRFPRGLLVLAAAGIKVTHEPLSSSIGQMCYFYFVGVPTMWRSE